MKSRFKTFIRTIKKYSLLFVGAVIAAVGLEIFLIPNQVIDGGIVGISIMLGYVTTLPIGLFIFVFGLLT